MQKSLGRGMELVRLFGRWIVAIAAFLGLGSIAAEILRRWMDRNGYLDHPENGIAWIVSTLADFTKHDWFYPLAAFILGLALGVWTDTILRRLTDDKAKQRRSLGYDMLDMANSIKARYRYSANWPSNCSDIRPSIDSLILKSK
jgi:hypothetical protein